MKKEKTNREKIKGVLKMLQIKTLTVSETELLAKWLTKHFTQKIK